MDSPVPGTLKHKCTRYTKRDNKKISSPCYVCRFFREITPIFEEEIFTKNIFTRMQERSMISIIEAHFERRNLLENGHIYSLSLNSIEAGDPSYWGESFYR
jgi:hypothetical protein